jgi:hypothetical protein
VTCCASASSAEFHRSPKAVCQYRPDNPPLTYRVACSQSPYLSLAQFAIGNTMKTQSQKVGCYRAVGVHVATRLPADSSCAGTPCSGSHHGAAVQRSPILNSRTMGFEGFLRLENRLIGIQLVCSVGHFPSLPPLTGMWEFPPDSVLAGSMPEWEYDSTLRPKS